MLFKDIPSKELDPQSSYSLASFSLECDEKAVHAVGSEGVFDHDRGVDRLNDSGELSPRGWAWESSKLEILAERDLHDSWSRGDGAHGVECHCIMIFCQ